MTRSLRAIRSSQNSMPIRSSICKWYVRCGAWVWWGVIEGCRGVLADDLIGSDRLSAFALCRVLSVCPPPIGCIGCIGCSPCAALPAVVVRAAVGWQSIGVPFVSPRELLFLARWRAEADGSLLMSARTVDCKQCPPQSGFVRAEVRCGGFLIRPVKGNPNQSMVCAAARARAPVPLPVRTQQLTPPLSPSLV
jgi:hypothetical protein